MPDETRELVQAGLSAWQIPFTERQIDELIVYRDLLVEWNATRMNLTRLVSPREIAAEHFLDSLSVLTAVAVPAGALLLDVGAGAGFPSLPIKILRPDISVTLLEATAKKLTFCRAVADALGLREIAFIHGRAEQPHGQLAAKFDIVTARAVAPLDRLAPWCARYLKRSSGVLVALKGARAKQEAATSADVLKALNLEAQVRTVDVAGSDKTHALIICRYPHPLNESRKAAKYRIIRRKLTQS